jgi:hypothetical protein
VEPDRQALDNEIAHLRGLEVAGLGRRCARAGTFNRTLTEEDRGRSPSMPQREFANQKALLAYAERNALVYAWERSPAFAKRQRLLSPKVRASAT